MSAPDGAVRGSATVLVVEDDAPTRALLGSILADEGIDYALSCSGPEALRVSAEVLPAMVLLDLHLPCVEGEMVAERLRTELGPELPILAMSASNEEATAERIGAFGFLGKPFEIADLIALIGRGLELSQHSYRLQARSEGARQRLVRARERLLASFEQRGKVHGQADAGKRSTG